MAPPQRAERPLDVALAGQQLEDMLGEDGDGYRRDQRVGPVADVLDVARGRDARVSRNRRGMNRRLHIHVVHVQKPCVADDRKVDVAGSQVQTGVAVPEHDPLALHVIDENHRIRVGGVSYGGMRDLDAAARQLLADQTSAVVVACRTHIAGSQPHCRTRAQRSGGLAAARDRVMCNPHLGRRAVRLRELGETVDIVHRVGTYADDIEHGRSI